MDTDKAAAAMGGFTILGILAVTVVVAVGAAFLTYTRPPPVGGEYWFYQN